MTELKTGRQERGAVLIVSLVVLLVLTLIGVAGMNTSVMQERMAVNAQNSNRTFQAAESSASALTERLIGNDLSLLRESMQSADNMSSSVNFTVDAGNGVAGTYQARYLGEIIAGSGSSLDANESSTALDGYRYELSGTATMAGTGATSTVFKGIEYY
ncbi:MULTISPECIES: PilX N-terminal domain-containing pilus assembly protein [Marinobacter]|uniref:PilX N-terminal domain-containing pilus assembly protein n=1 Tax=Marinobacter metalliresistant TaxID=2961995 RepID=A0ABZ2W040_9GAMM|nr:PilX N-terminal domain-containing pilus assembly protein [Marinobacter sp. Arc7-DN-1]AXS84461.1 PilX protein [Marinobacter sp. Arc7-DN-1]